MHVHFDLEEQDTLLMRTNLHLMAEGVEHCVFPLSSLCVCPLPAGHPHLRREPDGSDPSEQARAQAEEGSGLPL